MVVLYQAFLTYPLSMANPALKHRCFGHNPSASARGPPAPQVSSAGYKHARVIVVGGGAAGHLAAIVCARNCEANVSILESSTSVLQKVRISGGGRCNVSSAHDAHDIHAFAHHYPRGSREILSVLSRFGPNEVRAFFEAENVPLKVEETGKLFPTSDDSDTVVRALVEAANRAGVTTRLRARVRDIQVINGVYQLTMAGGSRYEADYLVVATGGARVAHSWAQNLGHTVVDTVPSLFTFGVKDNRLHGLAGVSVRDCQVQLVPKPKPKRPIPGLIQRGPVLVTHWGLSGPAILSLSAFGARVLYEHGYKMACSIDWIPTLSFDAKLSKLKEARRTLAQKTVLNIHPFRGIDASLKWGGINNRTIQRRIRNSWGSRPVRNQYENLREQALI
ncbi:flavoprotein HI0933 family [Gracilaria domingensis]|nr:flavoprotein HI0933 family [Gracilaria domingensis]